MNKIKLFIVFLFFSQIVFSQTTIKGLVIDEVNQSIPFVNVLIKADSSNVILAYTYSKENGVYTLKTNKRGKFNLTFSALGFQTQTFLISH